MTDAQERRIAEVCGKYDGYRVTPNAGPDADRAVVACPDGRIIVIGPDAEVIADTAGLQERPSVGAYLSEEERLQHEVPSNARRGLDRLLAEYPGFDVETLINQSTGFEGPDGPWTIVELAYRSGVSEVEKFGILNRTGSVYRYDPEHLGAVMDDPFLTVRDSP